MYYFGPSVELIFSQSASQRPDFADNDNTRFRMIFTRDEVSALNAVFHPHIFSGHVTRPLYKKGDDVSCIYLEKKPDGKSAVLAIVKQQQHETCPNYMVNFGIGYEPTATLNFPEVLRLSRMHLHRVFSAPPQHFSLI